MAIDIFTYAEHKNRLNTKATDMFMTLITHKQGDMISNEGVDKLTNIFGTVDETDRQFVFERFIGMLDTYQVDYDRSQFGAGL